MAANPFSAAVRAFVEGGQMQIDCDEDKGLASGRHPQRRRFDKLNWVTIRWFYVGLSASNISKDLVSK
jgi:hypothetical protein